jgi:carboxypeptidase PM20D1
VKILHNDDFSYTLASPPSPTDNQIFQTLSQSIQKHFKDVLPVPYLVLGASDARHFQDLSENIYRFMPFRLGANDVQRIHGTNERLAISSFYEGIYFYQRIISDFCNSY